MGKTTYSSIKERLLRAMRFGGVKRAANLYTGYENRIADNEFLEQFLDDMPSADKMYHKHLNGRKEDANEIGSS